MPINKIPIILLQADPEASILQNWTSLFAQSSPSVGITYSYNTNTLFQDPMAQELWLIYVMSHLGNWKCLIHSICTQHTHENSHFFNLRIIMAQIFFSPNWDFYKSLGLYNCYRSKLFLCYSLLKRVYFFFQTRSICFNLGQFEAGKKHRSQATGHMSELANTESILNIH